MPIIRRSREHPDLRRDRGFTLIEVVVAISIAALLLLSARALFEQLGTHAEAIVRAAAESDREANAEEMLRTLLGRAETSPQPERRFDGTGSGARFDTWCDGADPWLERCTATIGILRVDSADVLAVSTDGGDPLPLRRGFREGRLIYLRNASLGGDWVRNWSSAVAPPLAVGLVIDSDTTILPIGDRG